jgi:hypothetical protein
MRQLHGATCPSMFDVQIETHERKEHLNRLRGRARVLRGPCIYHVLVHEVRAAMGQGVGAELVVSRDVVAHGGVSQRSTP